MSRTRNRRRNKARQVQSERWTRLYAEGGGPSLATRRMIGERDALGISTYFACLRNLADDVAKIPLLTYYATVSGDRRIKRRAFDAPEYRLLHDEPNREMSAMTWKSTMIGNAASWGNAYSEIERDGAGRIVALWPIHPSRVTIERHPESRELIYIIRNDDGTMVYLDRPEIVHLSGFGGNGITGYSVLRYAAQSIGLTIAAHEFGEAFFGRGSHSNVALTHPKSLSKEAMDSLRESWQRVHSGPQNAYKPLILFEDMKIQTLTVPPREGQFLETRQLQIQEIARWFRMPMNKIQATEQSRGFEEEDRVYRSDTLMPWMMRFEQELNRKLFPADNSITAGFQTSELLRGNMTAQVAYFKGLFDIGSITPNEIRDALDLDPVGGGDATFVAVNNLMPLAHASRVMNHADAGRGAPTDESKPAEVTKPETPTQATAAATTVDQTIATASLNGAQISGLLEILANMSAGLLTAAGATSAIVAAFPQLGRDVAAEIVSGVVQDVAARPATESTVAVDDPPVKSIDKAEGHTPPKGVQEEAAKGLEWRREYGRGGTEVGVARARDLSNGTSVSDETIGRMVSYFARHEVDKQGQGWSPGEDGFPSAGRIAWSLWGGDPGRTWAESVWSSLGKSMPVTAASLVADLRQTLAPLTDTIRGGMARIAAAEKTFAKRLEKRPDGAEAKMVAFKSRLPADVEAELRPIAAVVIATVQKSLGVQIADIANRSVTASAQLWAEGRDRTVIESTIIDDIIELGRQAISDTGE
jgi:HK97 family phage portal protein